MSSRSLGSLTVNLLLEMGGFKQGMDKASREALKLERDMNARAKRIAGEFRVVGRALAAFGVGFSAIGIVRGLTQAGAAAIEFGDEMVKAQAKTGIGVERMSELAYAAKQTDVELDALSTSLKKMQVTLSEAGSGAKGPNETLAALGLTIEQLRQLKPEDQFEVLADRIAALQDPADRTRAAVELFGRAGADLLPLFEQGAAGIRAFREEAHRVNATMTGDQAKVLAEADDAIKRLGQAWDGVTRSATAFIALPLAATFDGLAEMINGQANLWDRAEKSALAYYRALREDGIFATPADAAREYAELLKEAEGVQQRFSTGTRLPPGGRNRKPFVPGFLPEPEKPGKVGKATSDAAREAEEALRREAEAYEDVLRAGQAAMDGLRSPLEEQIDQYHEAKFALEKLAETYPNLADQAEDALRRLEVDGLEDITITAEKILPPKEVEKLSVYWEEFGRNSQGIIADFLVDPFRDGIKGMLQDFGDMLQRMAAEAVAAQIAQKIFGAPGSGGGWLGTAAKAIGGFFGFAEGGFTGFGGKYEPAGIVHAGEGVLSQDDIRRIGGPSGFYDLLGAIRGYADGGLVTAGMGAAVMRGVNPDRQRAPLVGNMNFTIQAPQGTVSRATQQNIAAAAAKGLANANRRNN